MLPVLLAAAIAVPLPVGFRPAAMTAFDYDGDGKVDIAVAGEGLSVVAILRGDGRGGLVRLPPLPPAGANPTEMIAIGHDLVVANHDTQSITILRGGTVGQRIAVPSKPHPHTVAAADFDRDGHADLVVDSWAENRLLLLRGPAFTEIRPIDVGRKPYLNAVAADVNGDGKPDLVVPNAGRGTVSILLGDGRGGFAHAPGSPVEIGIQPFYAAVGDVDGDRRPDVVVACYSGQFADRSADGITWLLNEGGGRFRASRSRLRAGHAPTRIVTADLNGDRFADAVTMNLGSNDVTIAYGSSYGLRADTTTLPLGGTAGALCAADLDGDGRAEIIAATGEPARVVVISPDSPVARSRSRSRRD